MDLHQHLHQGSNRTKTLWIILLFFLVAGLVIFFVYNHLAAKSEQAKY